MTVQSFTDSKVTYETTLTSCTCPDRQYRHHTCKHMRLIEQEVERAARFLAIKAQVEQAEIEARERAEIEARENAGCYMRMMASPW
jgi:hypothetical protein